LVSGARFSWAMGEDDVSSPLDGWLRSRRGEGDVPEDELRDPKLIFHMLDTLKLERTRRGDPRWYPGEDKLEALTIERLARTSREKLT
jgi:hypothetical protein